jgi:hypothetical protein
MRTRLPRDPRLIIGLSGLIALIVLTIVGTVLLRLAMPPPDAPPVTQTVAPPAQEEALPAPTPAPTMSGISDEMLVCQRELGQAMNARNLVGAVNLSDDRALHMTWVSTEWSVRGLQDAVPGIIASLDAALEVWDQGCAIYDRVEIEVYDGPRDAQVHRLTVRLSADDLLQWRAGALQDHELLLRLGVIRPSD